MRKIIALLLIFMLTLLNGCNNYNTEDESCSNIIKAQNNIEGIQPLKNITIKQSEKNELSEYSCKDSFGIIGYYEDKVFFTLSMSDGSNNCSYVYYSYDTLNATINKVVEVPNFSASSGDILFCGDSFYKSDMVSRMNQVTGEKETINQFTENDFSNNTSTLLLEENLFPPFRYYEAIDDENMIIYGPNKTDDGYDYICQIYNVNTGDFKDVAKSHYNMSLNQGKTVGNAYFNNNHIFLYCTENNKNYIEVFTKDGEYQNKYSLPDLDMRIADKSPHKGEHGVVWKMKVVDNYFVFETLNNSILLYQLIDDQLEYVETEINMCRTIFADQIDNNKNIYFLSNTYEFLWVLDTQNATSQKVYFEFDNEFNKINGIACNGNGDLMLSMRSKDLSKISNYIYKIKSSDIN